MKQLLRLTLILLFVINGFVNLQAQVTLTQANVSLRSGDQFMVHEFNSIGSSAYYYAQNTPGNQTWIFNQLPVAGVRTALVKNRANAPYANSFPGANAVLDFQNTVFLPHVLSYIENTTGYAREVATDYPNLARIIEFTNPKDQLRFPFTFNDTYSDTFAGNYVQNGDSCVKFGYITVTADGYGTIITPAGTFNNVLRVKTLEFANDSCPPNLSHMGTIQTIATYDWYAPGIHFPVFRVLEHHAMLAIFWAGFYLDTNFVGLKEDQSDMLQFQVYPNPATNEVKMEFELSKSDPAQIILMNVLGQEVDKFEISNGNSRTHSLKVDLNKYQKGVYSIHLQSGNQTVTRKLIVK